MSACAETFYAIGCDFPDCDENYEGGECTDTSEPDEPSEYARDVLWLIDVGPDGALDFCPTHPVEGVCPPEGFVQGDDGSYCQRPRRSG